MGKETIDLIQLIADSNPDKFVNTKACLERRAKILDSVETIRYNHDSLASEYKTDYVRTLENCDSMLMVMFEKEYSQIPQAI